MRSIFLHAAVRVATLLAVAVGLAVAPAAAQPSEARTTTLPLFPLADVALFPNATQPFHIFEPRYREMVADALASDSIIGMVMLQPGYEGDYEGNPPVHAIGCAGVIIGAEMLSDGRYNIFLRGVTKFRIVGEDLSRAYRLAEVEVLPERVDERDRTLLSRRRRQVEEAIVAMLPGARLPPAALSDEQAIDAISLGLPMEPTVRQQLLEANGSLERALGLIRLFRGDPRASR